MTDPTSCKNCGAPSVGGPCEYCTTRQSSSNKKPITAEHLAVVRWFNPGPMTSEELDMVKYSSDPLGALAFLREMRQ